MDTTNANNEEIIKDQIDTNTLTTDNQNELEDTKQEQSAPPNPLAKQINIKLEKTKVREESKVQLRRISKTAKIDGFRVGKIPPNILQKYYGKRAEEDAMSTLLEQEWNKIINEQQIRFIGEPEVQPGLVDETHFSFDFHYEAYPEFELNDCFDKEIVHQAYTVKEEDINKTIERMRSQVAKFEDSTEAAKNGDLVDINFNGTIDDVPFQGGSAENYKFILGNDKMLPEFELGIIGMMNGEEKTISLTFPENYAEEMKGKTAQFVIKLNNTQCKILPELDADFIQSLGVKSGEYSDLVTEVTNNVNREVNRRLSDMNRVATFNLLVENNQSFPLPNALIYKEMQGLYQRQFDQYKKMGIADPSKYIDIAAISEQAKKQVRLNLILEKLISSQEKEAFVPSDEEVKQLITEESSGYENSKEYVEWAIQDKELYQKAFSRSIEQKLINHINSKLKINSEEASFDKLMLNSAE